MPSFSYACCYLCNEKEKKINKSGHLHSALKLWAGVVLAFSVSESGETLCQLLMASVLLGADQKSLIVLLGLALFVPSSADSLCDGKHRTIMGHENCCI